MLTLGVLTAAAIAGGHALMFLTLWPGERAVPVGASPDPVLRFRASTLEGISETARREADGLRDKLKLAIASREGAEAETATARGEVRALETERATLRREVKRLTRAAVLAATDGEDEAAGGTVDAGYTPGPRH